MCWGFVAILSLFLVGSQALAKGKGKGQGSATPPGWEKGKRKAGRAMRLRESRRKVIGNHQAE